MKEIRLHPGREKRVLQGHRWIFSNEIADRLPEFEPGSWVDVRSAKGVPLGTGYINPRSLIAVRLMSPPGREPDRDFLRRLIAEADALRTDLLYPGSTCYRAVYGESDGLPGLVVDRYGDVLVTQVTTLGMSLMENMVHELLAERFHPRAVVSRNDSPVRTLEGLPLEKKVAHGELPGELWVEIDGIQLRVDPLEGQKTGLFLDQRDNRLALRRWVKGKRVLDAFCYNGAWSLSAAAGGAAEVVGVDDSALAVGQAEENAARNGFGEICSFRQGEVFRFLRNAKKGGLDVVILDPPAFARTRNALPEAVKGYTDLNRRALLAMNPGNILVTCSCSYHMSGEMFLSAVLQAGKASGRQLKLLEMRGQALDHPSLLAMPETSYLKCAVLQVIQAGSPG
ncbi:MAG: class I SAM-dependent rRNA methyltransferase [Syntrophobacteraceae bacterium]|nr:class I SAM-dependent rRNA methyltransferase [Desulfobacteraceae bacterium]